MLRISVSKAGEVPRAHVFEKREITVGRTAANDLMISEPGVSSAHARVLFTGTEVTIIDLESTNGTFVNGTRIQGPYILAPRDEVYICAHRLEFEIAAGAMAGPNTGGRGVGMTSDPSIQPPSPAFAASPAPSPAPGYPSSPPPLGPPAAAFGAPSPAFGAAPSPAFGGMPQSEPPPLGPPAPLDAGLSSGGPPMSLGVPSAVGVGGPRPRSADEPPTMPPPITPIGGPSLGAPAGAMTSAPSMPPPLEFSSPNLAADLGDLPPPVVAEAPARTGATLTPSQGG
ncbi:MAG: FHA domain-containing protein, partial [Nannocystaceae bacterium]|nr:FHA domain-containing protein [Nannocystaceae bacterium]